MELLELKWTKNFNKLYKTEDSSKWSGHTYKIGEAFKLHWRNKNNKDEINANEPKKGEMILLRQHSTLTQIVRLIDVKTNSELEDRDEFNIYRLVELIWITKHWNNPPSTKEFFATGINFPANGKVHKLTKLKAFKQRWGEEGLAEFQHYLQQELEKY